MESLLAKLQCPFCHKGQLERASFDKLICEACHQSFPVLGKVPVLFGSRYLAGREPCQLLSDISRVKQKNENTGGAYHWKEYDIEGLIPAAGAGREVLLLGCGDGSERRFLQRLGYQSLAFDVRLSDETDFLADAHCLPLRDATFDAVISMQVFEHLPAPWVAAGEISRILRPEGWFVGSVAFLKPYHNSFFHMTHKGISALLTDAGMQVEKVRGAQSLTFALYGGRVPLFNRSMSRFIYRGVDLLIDYLRARLWSLRTGKSPDAPSDRFDPLLGLSFCDFDKLRFAPSVVFRAVKKT